MHNASPVAGRTIQALRVAAPWTETGVTWANQPGTSGTAATTVTSGSAGTLAWNVLNQVQSMVASGNYGFLIRDAAENADAEQGIHPREKAPDLPPQLVITYG